MITIDRLDTILTEVKYHHFLKRRCIKYTNCDYDSRTRSFWRIEFRHWFGQKPTLFTNTNRPIEERRELYEEIMEWLKNG